LSLKILIVDDDERERIVLRYIVEQMEDVRIIGETSNGIEAVLLAKEKKPDLVFLDIVMPDTDGLETARKLKEIPNPPLFVFVTLHREKAVEAFALDALDYIVKPMEPNRIRETIDRANHRLAHEKFISQRVEEKLRERINILLKNLRAEDITCSRLPIKQRGKIALLNQDDIIFAESRGKKVFICTDQEEFATGFTLNELEDRLDKTKFFRAHQAFIVNLNRVKEIVAFGEGSFQINVENSNKEIILSRSRAKMLRNKLGI
jgi:two-component system LytT family response regulator/two-component system response regulator LytT